MAVILLNKPAGISSAKAVAILKKRLNLKKIGHAGTLDPFATGLLVCLSDKSTKLADNFQGGYKVYSGTIKLGIATDTEDITGTVISTSDKIPTADQIRQVSRQFVGLIKQTPPAISAIKVNGKRSYQLARSGQAVELKEREVEVFSFEIPKIENEIVHYLIKCSKGTYIRAIARDLGLALGCGACVNTLCREESFPFKLQQAKEIDLIIENDLISTEGMQF